MNLIDSPISNLTKCVVVKCSHNEKYKLFSFGAKCGMRETYGLGHYNMTSIWVFCKEAKETCSLTMKNGGSSDVFGEFRVKTIDPV